MDSHAAVRGATNVLASGCPTKGWYNAAAIGWLHKGPLGGIGRRNTQHEHTVKGMRGIRLQRLRVYIHVLASMHLLSVTHRKYTRAYKALVSLFAL